MNTTTAITTAALAATAAGTGGYLLTNPLTEDAPAPAATLAAATTTPAPEAPAPDLFSDLDPKLDSLGDLDRKRAPGGGG
ncbi:MAG: hypothetical protein LBK99_00430, partial [Opitutaceae bacterium]|nr:hypothetical protein [Opitutaceae bacterium]